MKTNNSYRALSIQLQEVTKVIFAMLVIMSLSLGMAIFTVITYHSKITHLNQMIQTLEESMLTKEDIDDAIKSNINLFSQKEVQPRVNETIVIIEDQESIVETVAPIVDVEETNVLSTDAVNIEALTKTINEIAPELVGIEDAVLKNYELYAIDPAFQLAVFCLESGYGTSSLSQNKNNICGFNAYPTETASAYQNATYFETKSDCVTAFGNTINSGYISNNLVTVSAISQKYCPPNSSEWSANVLSLKDKINMVYNNYNTENWES